MRSTSGVLKINLLAERMKYFKLQLYSSNLEVNVMDARVSIKMVKIQNNSYPGLKEQIQLSNDKRKRYFGWSVLCRQLAVRKISLLNE